MRGVRFLLILVLVLISKTSFAQSGQSQLLKEVSTNCKVRYYYYPNLEAYFDKQNGIYFLQDNGQWITALEIPASYHGYSLYNKAMVPVTDYDDDDPTQFIDKHRKQYPARTIKSVRMTASLN
jgi:hypothetical protein